MRSHRKLIIGHRGCPNEEPGNALILQICQILPSLFVRTWVTDNVCWWRRNGGSDAVTQDIIFDAGVGQHSFGMRVLLLTEGISTNAWEHGDPSPL
ncbi:MAG: hypothetical protein CM1200mP41_33880 [Gammaproteobacteria bacterium]|nr:MAG: hypothetical protein CM1200mP41_33880 [Gammaproteobacteria bacterium]